MGKGVSINELINVLEPELRRYYHYIKERRVTPMNHNVLLIIIADSVGNEDEFISKVREVYAYISSNVKNVKIKPPTKTTPIPCTCGYPKTYEPNTLLSTSGTPLPHPTCPAGILTFYTTARINKDITLTTPPTNQGTKITPNTEILIGKPKTQQTTTTTIIPRNPTPSKNHKPLQRTNT